MDHTIGRLIRLRDSFVAEAIIIVIAYGNVAAIVAGHKTAWRLRFHCFLWSSLKFPS
jgi:hypothetical protein